MKVRRTRNGKVYAVHNTRAIVVGGIDLKHIDYLVNGSNETLDDVLPDEAPDGKFWLDGYAAVEVDDDTPVDVL